jgi:hypothetical protein
LSPSSALVVLGRISNFRCNSKEELLKIAGKSIFDHDKNNEK